MKLDDIICKYLGGHKWRVDFPSLPCYRTCSRCGKKQHVNIQKSYSSLSSPMVWEDVKK